MLAALIAAVFAGQSPTTYDATLVLAMPTRGIGSRTWIGGVTLADEGTVAGNTCDSVGVHGETLFAKPFVWSRGVLHTLPLGKAQYGHVVAGNAKMLVGDVIIDYLDHPATWTPDPEAGWSKARLTVLPELEGRAMAVTDGGTVWVAGSDAVLRWERGKWSSFHFGQFYVEGLDARGRFYGNRFEGYGEGMSPLNTQASVRDGFEWVPLAPKTEISWLSAVNAGGTAVGRVGPRAVLWKGGATIYLFGSEVPWSEARAINGSGQVVGEFRTGDTLHAYVWRSGRLQDLWTAHPDGLREAVAVSDAGTIVAKAEKDDQTRLYLLRPKP